MADDSKGKCTCWKDHERVPGTKPCAKGSCRKRRRAASSLKEARDPSVRGSERVAASARARVLTAQADLEEGTVKAYTRMGKGGKVIHVGPSERKAIKRALASAADDPDYLAANKTSAGMMRKLSAAVDDGSVFHTPGMFDDLDAVLKDHEAAHGDADVSQARRKLRKPPQSSR